MHTKHYLLLLLLGLGSLAYGQQFKTVLPRPAKFDKPIDFYEIDRNWQNIDGPNGKERWVVYSDRSNNPLFSAPGGTPNGKRMAFKEMALVVEKKDDWLRLIKWAPGIALRGTTINNSAKVEELGWIRRDNLILWERALVANEESNIHRKVLLVHFDVGSLGAGFKVAPGDKIKICNSPDENSNCNEQEMYSFFFVLKRQGDQLLLGYSDRFYTTDAEDQILGWVSKHNASPWNTRVALEPNTLKTAFLERKQNPDFQFPHYIDGKKAQAHKESGGRQEGLIRITDPAKSTAKGSVIEYATPWKRDCVSKTDTMQMVRFEGGILRHPILGCDNSGTYYLTSLVGTIDEHKQSYLEKIANRYADGINRWNVVFLIDGTREMREYRDELFNAVRHVQDYVGGISPDIKLQTSAVIYRDEPEEAAGQLIEEIPPTTPSRLIQRLQEVRFYSEDPGDDDFTAYHYGLEKSLALGAFKQFEVNVIIHVGFGGDVANAPLIRPQDHKIFLKRTRLDAIQKKLSENQVAYLSMQWRNKDLRAYHKFIDNGYELLLSSAQYGHRTVDSLLRKLEQQRPERNPSMEPEPDECGYMKGKPCRMIVANAMSPLILYTPGAGRSIGGNGIREEMIHFFDQIFSYNKEVRSAAFEVINNGVPIDDERIEAGAREKLILALSTVLSEDELETLKKQRTRILVQSYVPMTIPGMRHALSSMVVLMTKQDLNNTLDRLEELNRVLNRPMDQRREALYNLLCDQLHRAAGESQDCSKANMRDAGKTINGLEGECIDIPMPENWRLEDIMKSRKVSDEDIENYSCRIATNRNAVRRITDGDYPYKFKRSGTEFYWIPLEFIL